MKDEEITRTIAEKVLGWFMGDSGYWCRTDEVRDTIEMCWQYTPLTDSNHGMMAWKKFTMTELRCDELGEWIAVIHTGQKQPVKVRNSDCLRAMCECMVKAVTG